MNSVHDRQTPANKNRLPCNPIESISNGKHLTSMNAKIDKSVAQNEMPISFTRNGIISAITKEYRVEIPNVEKKMITEKLAREIHLNDSIS